MDIEDRAADALPQAVRDSIDQLVRDLYDLPAIPRVLAHRIITLSHASAFMQGQRAGLADAKAILEEAA